MRVGRSGIQAAQLDLGPEDMADVVQQAGQNDGAGEDLAFVDQVREPVRVFFRPEFVAGALSLLSQQLEDARPQRIQEIAAHPAIEHDVAVLVEVPLFVLGHRFTR
jgi:hypothetical protein